MAAWNIAMLGADRQEYGTRYSKRTSQRTANTTRGWPTTEMINVRKENFGRLAADMRSFVAKYPAGERVDHLPAWAQWLDENGDKEAVGLYGTSVAENLWHRAQTCPHCGNSTDETEPVPLSEGTEVYEWLERLQTHTQTGGNQSGNHY
jgi:hypothetical protein